MNAGKTDEHIQETQSHIGYHVLVSTKCKDANAMPDLDPT
jgi:hypothetical protein